MYYLELLFFFLLLSFSATSKNPSFTYHGFRGANISLDGIASITPNGLLMLTNQTLQQMGHAFYPDPLHFKNQTNNETFSFSSTFVFAMIPEQSSTVGGHGICFVIAPSRSLPGALPTTYLGLFNRSNNGKWSNHVLAIELDTIYSAEFGDINNNHIGIDINDLRSVISAPASYFTNGNGDYKNLSLLSGKPMQLWVEYNGVDKQLNVTIAPIKVSKPVKPLLSLVRDLSPIIQDVMYVGFSASNSPIQKFLHVLGWSFQMNGKAQELNPLLLPKLPKIKHKVKLGFLVTGSPIISLVFVITVIFGVFFVIRRKRKFAEVLEDWEIEYGPHRFKYKDLYIATNGFSDKELLGIGGFGRVYRGVLPNSKIEVAIKRVSHESRQGMKEFVSEIVSMGRLRHRNLVQLLGYCRRKGELILVYDFMPNGSLDKWLFNKTKSTLNWSQRFRIIKGVAFGLFYLHEGWEQEVIHRDVKASNVLLDGELNAKLGDFGLARLYDHGSHPKTTHVVGTFGYIAPEIIKTGKATSSSDVFAFGIFILEVVCGRRPIVAEESSEAFVLVDWVFSCCNEGGFHELIDPNLGTNYVVEEVEMVLKVGLLCSHYVHAARPSMQQVVQILDGDVAFPELSFSDLTFVHNEGFGSFQNKAFSQSTSIADSILSQGR